MTDLAYVVIALGALAGGTVSGLGGFGLALICMPIWLQVLAPAVATPLVVICSVLAQLQLLPGVWQALELRRLLPLIAGGLLGIPIGTFLLPLVPAAAFRAGFGVVLVVVCMVLLFARSEERVGDKGKLAEALVGGVGGVLGGLSGLSGPATIIWAHLRGWGKDESRATFLAFNLSILVVSMGWQAAAGLITAEVSALVLVAYPATWIGTMIGVRFYKRLNLARFNQFVMLVLVFAGAAMVLGTASELLSLATQ